MLMTLGGAKHYKPDKKEMDDVEQIRGENDDSDEVTDPEYKLFFESLKKYKRSHVPDGGNNDVSVCVENGRKIKMRKDIERVDGVVDHSPRPPNAQVSVNQHASNNRRNENLMKQSDLKNKGIIKESNVGFSKVLSRRMNNLGSYTVSKNMNFVQEDNILTDNQSERRGQARLRKADKREDVAKAHYVPPDGESVILISCDENQYQGPDPRNNSDSKNEGEIVGQLQSIKRKKKLKVENVVLNEHNLDTENHLYLKPDPNSMKKFQGDGSNQVVPSEEDKEFQSKINLLEVMSKKNVAMDGLVANRKDVIYKDNEPLYQKFGPRKNLKEHQHEDISQTQLGWKHKVQSPVKLRKMVHGCYQIKVDDAANRNNAAQIEKLPLFHKPCPRKNQVTENCVDQDHPKQSHSMFMKEKYITGDSDSDVEILDSTSIYAARNQGSIVVSTRFQKSVMGDDNIELLQRASPRFEFRRQIINVLREPYDKEETKRLQKIFEDGSYKKFHPDFAKKLTSYRHKKGKCLAMLRGFFFWIKSVTQEGSFKPWEDKECIGVDPTLF